MSGQGGIRVIKDFGRIGCDGQWWSRVFKEGQDGLSWLVDEGQGLSCLVKCGQHWAMVVKVGL